MRYFIDPRGAYYEGDRAHALDLEVPQRPTQYHNWAGGAWIAPDPLVVLDLKAALAVDAMDRLQNTLLFRMENDIRELRAVVNTLKPGAFPLAAATQITKPDFRDRLMVMMRNLLSS